MASRKETVLEALREIVPDEAILSREEQLRPYECDGLTAYRQLPMLVVLPSTVEHIQTIVKLCARLSVPIVARGAGTGLSAGALPLQSGVLLSLARFNQILHVDTYNRTARVQPGVRNLAISEAVSHLGLFYAPDPSSQIACSIGGNVAENSGGVHCLKYGLTVHNIQQIKIVDIKGDLITLGGSGLDSAGYDLLALMTGSEGLLGIVVEVTVKLLPKPPSVQVMLAAFNDVARAGEAVSAIISSGIIPAGLEMMDNPAIRAAEAFAEAGYPLEAAAILICEVDGCEQEVEEQCHQIIEVLQQHNATEVRVAENEQQRCLMWKGRKSAFPAVGRLAPDYYCMDGTIPRKQLSKVLSGIAALSQQYDLPVANVFHAGDGNLHPLILYDANKKGELEKTEEFGAKILQLCVEVGGTITGEHGVGKEKIDQMCIQFQTLELAQFHAIKEAFDPRALLNPGKAVPSLHRCAELGAMHVHNGQLPFANIERF